MGATLKSRLPAIAAELRPKVSAAVKKGAQLVAEEARERVPIGPPDVHIKDDIRVARQGPAEYAVLAGDENTWYGHMVEFGTSHSAPRPFLVPALEEHRGAAVNFVRVALRTLE